MLYETVAIMRTVALAIGALVLSALLGTSYAGAATSKVHVRPNAGKPIRCYGSVSQRGENVPVDTVDRAHDVTHSAAIFQGSTLLAWLYQDRNGTLWFEGVSDPKVPLSMIGRVASSMGISSVNRNQSRDRGTLLRGYTIQIIKPMSLQPLAGSSLNIHTCY